MSRFFLAIVNMSISAGWIVLAVALLRVLLKKAPKRITLFLWGIVAVRLVCPVSVPSAFSLIPSTKTVRPEIMLEETPAIQSGIAFINDAVNPILGQSFAAEPSDSVNPLQILIPVLAAVYLVGIAVLLCYAVISYIKIKRKTQTAVLYRDNVYQSEAVRSPFVFGLVKPRIFLPFQIDPQVMPYVLAHEKAHLERKDYLFKPLGFLLAVLHWFHPLIWLGYVLFCRDLELACDERVIRAFRPQQKADYSQALLTCSIKRHTVSVCPVAFGEIAIKERVKFVLNYKKSATGLLVLALAVCVCCAGCFLTDPYDAGTIPQTEEQAGKETTTEETTTEEEISAEAETEEEWILKPVKVSFSDSDRHRFYKAEIQSYTEENESVFGYTVYHRVFKHCLDCREVVEADEVYPCQWNNPDCRGGCLNGHKNPS